MLNLFRYIAVVIMVLACGELVLKSIDTANSLIASLQAKPAQGDSATESGSRGGSDAPANSAFQQVQKVFYGVINLLSQPLLHFCYGATLFVLVRIARDQAHDLAVG